MLKFIQAAIRLSKLGLPLAHAIEALAVAVDPALSGPIGVLSNPANEAALEAIVAKLEADFAAANPPAS